MMDFDLKEVFSILDENNEGQIQLRRFVDVANNYYSDAEVSESTCLRHMRFASPRSSNSPGSPRRSIRRTPA